MNARRLSVQSEDDLRVLRRAHARFREFLHFSRGDHYAQAPHDWLVVITDIEGSTAAIEAGKYKWVNLVGASTIVALANALGTRDFPFVFGGDGATALIPGEAREAAERYLRAARRNSWDAFGLKLRVGIIPQSELEAAGTPVEVARHHLPSGAALAFFGARACSRRKNGSKPGAESWAKARRRRRTSRFRDSLAGGRHSTARTG